MRPSDLVYGTTPTIVPPTGAVAVMPGDDLQALVTAHPPGTTYALRAGLHRGQSVVPKDGDTYIGEYGAVLSGARRLIGWRRVGRRWYVDDQHQTGVLAGDPAIVCEPGHARCVYPEDLHCQGVMVDHAPSMEAAGPGAWFFDVATGRVWVWDDPLTAHLALSVTPHAFSGYATGVTLQNLVIEGYACPTDTGAVYAQGTGWTIARCEIRQCHADAVKHSSGTRISGCYLHHNGNFGITGAGRGVVIEANEIAYNGCAWYNHYCGAGGSKWVLTEDLHVVGNFSHHNFGPGLWTDISNNNTLYEYNRCEANHSEGIFHEISYSAVVRYNTCAVNGMGIHARPSPWWVSGAGILILNASHVQVYGNIVTNNWQNICVLDDAARYSNPVDETHGAWGPVTDFDAHDNVVTTHYSSAGAGRTGLLQAQSTGTPFEATAHNGWHRNSYRLDPRLAEPFVWANASATPAAWQAAGHDTDGTMGV